MESIREIDTLVDPPLDDIETAVHAKPNGRPKRNGGRSQVLDREAEQRYARQLQEARERFEALVGGLPKEIREAATRRRANGGRSARRWSLPAIETYYERIRGCMTTIDDPATVRIVNELRECKHRIDESREALVLGNLGFVVRVAREFQSQTIPFMDLVQEGNLGLLEAVDRFEPKRGYRLATYAFWWVRRAISMAVTAKARMIPLPSHVRAQMKELTRIRAELVEQTGRQPSTTELAGVMGTPTRRVEELLAVARDPYPIDNIGSPTEEPTILRNTPDPTCPDPLETTLDRERNRRLTEALGVLDPREERIVRLRFGIGQTPRHTLEQIGQVLNLSRERVRQIVLSALAKLRATTHDLGPQLYS